MNLNHDAAMQILEFMDKYSEHFRELRSFIDEKQEKVAGDDLVWLLDSLSEEQRFVMQGNSLEAKRKLIFEEHGIEDYNAAKLTEACPEEVKGRMKLATDIIDDCVNYIKETNEDILEMARRKLEAQADDLKDSLILGGDTYSASGSKIKKMLDVNNNLGSV
jgi:hypothetical protein